MGDNDEKSWMREYLDQAFNSVHKRMDDIVEQSKNDSLSTNNRLDCIDKNIASHEKTLSRLTDTVEVHEQRSTNLEKATLPMREEFHQRMIIEAYKRESAIKRKEKFSSLAMKMKWPGIILTFLTGLSGLWAIFGDAVKGLFK
jgi:hypothetical protein